jgi:hypothetical protein
LELSDQENDMRSKLLGGVAALALTACTVLASAAPASAAPWGWRHGGYGYGWGPGAVAAGIVGGTIAAVTSPLWAPGYYGNSPGYAYGNSGYYDYSPGYAYGPSYGYVAAPAMVAGDSSLTANSAFARTICQPECIWASTASITPARNLNVLAARNLSSPVQTGEGE